MDIDQELYNQVMPFLETFRNAVIPELQEVKNDMAIIKKQVLRQMPRMNSAEFAKRTGIKSAKAATNHSRLNPGLGRKVKGVWTYDEQDVEDWLKGKYA